ncbi:MAG: glycosyltransferase family 1 protein [Proteobacteria bacterium]|nr:glycosyltransferase family 1 protein [Pseudomonadota bacterium]
MRILIVSDVWHPQVNGVVRTLVRTVAALEGQGHEIEVIGPDRFVSLPCPSYPEIRLALWPKRTLAKAMQRLAPDAIHITTEGPLGLAARRVCRRHRLRFTTAYHTQFPEYLEARTGLPRRFSYAFMRWFHGGSAAVMVATDSLESHLAKLGFRNLRRWSRGVDTERFRLGAKDAINAPRPILLYAGRIAIDKNIEAFLELKTPGTKVVVGDGPHLPELRRRYPDALYTGYLENGALAAHYRSADVFVFPSRTDTFGLVLLEAMASGVPVAAYPAIGSLDVVGDSGAGALDEDLAAAVTRALSIPAEICRARALQFTWEAASRQFLGNLISARPEPASLYIPRQNPDATRP